MAVRGDKATAQALRALSQQVAVPIAATSRFALQPTLKTAKSNARNIEEKERTNTLANSLVIKQKARTSKLNPTFQVGPDSSVEKQTKYGLRRPVKYAHLLEFGTAPHYQPGRGVVHPGSRPEPFLTPAYFETREQVVKRFGDKIGPEMEKRAAKLAAKQAKTK
jgi:HK97 gp10 family phage protein